MTMPMPSSSRTQTPELDQALTAGADKAFERWVQRGIEAGYLVTTCLMHDSYFTDREMELLDEWDDPCIPRLIVDPRKLPDS